MSDAAKTKLTVGRVQTAILSAIEQRCEAIKNFVSEKYFEHYGFFRPTAVGSAVCVKGIYFEDSGTGFKDDSRTVKLKACIGKSAKLIDSKIEKKVTNPPQLYNLNAVQKDAFKYFGYSADKTLKIIQSLYEELKCVSYPRTPSRVMGSGNVELCQEVADKLSPIIYDSNSQERKLSHEMQITLSNKHCFNDSKLEAHHALIPLNPLPTSANEEQKNIYNLILERFFTAFLPEERYEKLTYILEVEEQKFKVTGKKIISLGWKKIIDDFNFRMNFKDVRNVSVQEDEENEEEEQSLDNINWNALILSDIETEEKWTKPPAYFNEASILSFMENPKEMNRQVSVDDDTTEPTRVGRKLIGLGTAATRHTFIPYLLKRGYIELQKKNLICTELGSLLLKAVRSSSIKSLADISTTTDWEERMNDNPDKYLDDIKTFVRDSVSQNVQISVPVVKKDFVTECPVCGNEIRKGKMNWYCSGYKEGCDFNIWEKIAGAKLSEKDVIALCEGKKTGIKHCISKAGKAFDCKFELDDKYQIRFAF